MARKQEWTQVSERVGRITFDVSGGDIPETTGFQIEVSYATQADMLKMALNSTRIAVQNQLRENYRKHKAWLFQPGKITKVSGSGELGALSPVERLLSNPQLLAGATDEQKRQLAQLLGLVAPDEAKPLETLPEATGIAREGGFDEDELMKLSLTKLRIIAQNKGVEGYDELTKEEIIEELVMLDEE